MEKEGIYMSEEKKKITDEELDNVAGGMESRDIDNPNAGKTKCPICGKYIRRDALVMHKFMEHGGQEKLKEQVEEMYKHLTD